MSKCLIEQSSLTAIGDAVRSKTGTNELYTIPEGLVSAIRNISTGISGDIQIRQFALTAETKNEAQYYLELPSDPGKLGIAIVAVLVERKKTPESEMLTYTTEQLLYIVNSNNVDYAIKYFGHKPAEGFFGLYDPLDNPNVQNEFLLLYQGPSDNEGYDKYIIAMNYNGYGFPMSAPVEYLDGEVPTDRAYEIVSYRQEYNEDDNEYKTYVKVRFYEADLFELRGLFAVEVV